MKNQKQIAKEAQEFKQQYLEYKNGLEVGSRKVSGKMVTQIINRKESTLLGDFTKKQIKDRVLNFDWTIKDGLDLFVLLSMHNIVTNVTICKKYIDIYGLTTEKELRYFSDNFVRIYLPRQSTTNAEMDIMLCDYGDEDKNDRLKVKKYLKDVLPETSVLPLKIYFTNQF